MHTRRQDLAAAAAAAASAVAFNPFTMHALEAADPARTERYRIPHRLGLGGVAIGTGFAPLTGEQSDEVMRAAWAAGNRYCDSSPWYGLGLSERRMGHVLAD